MRGGLAVVLAASLLGGCASNSFTIPRSELQRLAAVPPAQRGQHVRVSQELNATAVDPATPVTGETQIIFVPDVNVGYTGGGGYHGGGGHGGGGGMHIGGSGGDGKAEAVALIVVAALALFVAAGIEGSRFDGYAQVHPMMPLHLIGRGGEQIILPLAWLDAATAAYTERAIVRPNEGPWNELERAPLDRQGFTYGVYGGVGSLRSALGDKELGPAWTIQFGYFPEQHFGVLGSVFFGWRNNRVGETLFESRYTLELQAMPVQLGILHAGLYGGLGLAYRWEDGVDGGNSGSSALVGGAQFQLDINTRIAITARLGISRAHDEQMHDAIIGLSVY